MSKYQILMIIVEGATIIAMFVAMFVATWVAFALDVIR